MASRARSREYVWRLVGPLIAGPNSLSPRLASDGCGDDEENDLQGNEENKSGAAGALTSASSNQDRHHLLQKRHQCHLLARVVEVERKVVQDCRP
jgi:hypothetical protein